MADYHCLFFGLFCPFFFTGMTPPMEAAMAHTDISSSHTQHIPVILYINTCNYLNRIMDNNVYCGLYCALTVYKWYIVLSRINNARSFMFVHAATCFSHCEFFFFLLMCGGLLSRVLKWEEKGSSGSLIVWWHPTISACKIHRILWDSL